MRRKLLHCISLTLLMFLSAGSVFASAGSPDIKANGTKDSEFHNFNDYILLRVIEEGDSMSENDSLYLTKYLHDADSLLKYNMNAVVASNLKLAVSNAKSLFDSETFTTALCDSFCVNLTSAVNDAQVSVGIYRVFNVYFSHGLTLDKEGSAYFLESLYEVISMWENGEITTGVKELETTERVLVEAVKRQVTPGSDMSMAISDYECNGGYKFGQFTQEQRAQAVPYSWYVTDAQDDVQVVDVDQYFHVNTWSTENNSLLSFSSMSAPYIEFWSTEEERYLQNHNFNIKHVKETGFRPGKYMLGAMLRFSQLDALSPEGYSFEVNGKKSTPSVSSPSNGSVYSYEEVYFDVDDTENIDIKFNLNHPNFSWFAFNSLSLTYYGDATNKTVYVDIAKADSTASENLGNTVVKFDNNSSYYVYEPQDSTQGMTLYFDMPVSEMKVNDKCDIAVVMEPVNEAKSRPSYVGFGIKGVPTRLTDNVDDVMISLGSYEYSGEKRDTIEVKDITIHENIINPKLVVTTETHIGVDCETSLGLKSIAVDIINDEQTDIDVFEASDEVEGIYSPSGVRLNSLQSGVNMVKMSNGAIKKVHY